MKYNRMILSLHIRKYYNKTELLQKLFQILFLYSTDTYLKLIIAKKQCFKVWNNYFKTRIKDFCIVTGRNKGICIKYKVSRIVFRLLNNKGILFGIKKSNW